MQGPGCDLLHSSGRLMVFLISPVEGPGPARNEQFTLTSCITSLGGATHWGDEAFGASLGCCLFWETLLWEELTRNISRVIHVKRIEWINPKKKYWIIMTGQDRTCSPTRTVGGPEARGVDLLGSHAYNDKNDNWDGAGLSEDNRHNFWENSPALDWGLQRNMGVQTCFTSLDQF